MTFFVFGLGERARDLAVNLWRRFCCFFLEHLRIVSLVLGLKYSCSWPRQSLSSESLSLPWTRIFFCVIGLGLEPYALDSTFAIISLTITWKVKD